MLGTQMRTFQRLLADTLVANVTNNFLWSRSPQRPLRRHQTLTRPRLSPEQHRDDVRLTD